MSTRTGGVSEFVFLVLSLQDDGMMKKDKKDGNDDVSFLARPSENCAKVLSLLLNLFVTSCF